MDTANCSNITHLHFFNILDNTNLVPCPLAFSEFPPKMARWWRAVPWVKRAQVLSGSPVGFEETPHPAAGVPSDNPSHPAEE